MTLNFENFRTALPQIAVSEEGERIVISPINTEEVADVLAHCNGRRLAVEIAGAGTKRAWSGIRRPDVVLRTARLTGVCEHPWQDLTATVGAGTPWAEMQGVLARHGQFVGLDPLWVERATIGGVLATNDSGAIRLRYGSARDLVIGMTVVLADGTIAKTGGKVVKNVAGYDLHKLMIGAFGTLAVVTEVTFRLHPLPTSRAVWSVNSVAMEPLARLSAAITKAHLNAEAVQIRTISGGFCLDILLAAAPEVLLTKAREFAGMAALQELKPYDAQGGIEVFGTRARLFEASGDIMLKLTALQSAIPGILCEITRSGGRAVGYPLGIVYATFPDHTAIPQTLGGLVEAAGGSITKLGELAEPTKLMREIRQRFGAERFI